jgi:hypothetical protein
MSSIAARNDELIREYREGLRELTFNSKPIINNLTIIAGENVGLCRDIAPAIVDRMRQVLLLCGVRLVVCVCVFSVLK